MDNDMLIGIITEEYEGYFEECKFLVMVLFLSILPAQM
jgi:hypothetical protein